jgi:outer membrane protein TolC
VAAQEARVELARKAPLPDFDVSLQLGIRANNSDMVTFMVSAPVPLRRAQRQDERLAEARADLSALESEHRSMTNELLSEVARVHAELERSRAQLALFAAAVLPQGRAALEAATAAFQVGRADFQTVLESRSTLFEYELAYERALTDFAGSVAELERLLGAEVLP